MVELSRLANGGGQCPLASGFAGAAPLGARLRRAWRPTCAAYLLWSESNIACACHARHDDMMAENSGLW